MYKLPMPNSPAFEAPLLKPEHGAAETIAASHNLSLFWPRESRRKQTVAVFKPRIEVVLTQQQITETYCQGDENSSQNGIVCIFLSVFHINTDLYVCTS